jgi:hypothetical protein
VEVVVQNKACWLHSQGMIYSLSYTKTPGAEHVPYMTTHLENHRWCLELAKGVYGHRSLLEAWVRAYLPDATVMGFSPNDIIYPDESKDRPLLKGPHSSFAITHSGKFVYSTKESSELAIVAMDLRKKVAALAKGESIYFRGNF